MFSLVLDAWGLLAFFGHCSTDCRLLLRQSKELRWTIIWSCTLKEHLFLFSFPSDLKILDRTDPKSCCDYIVTDDSRIQLFHNSNHNHHPPHLNKYLFGQNNHHILFTLNKKINLHSSCNLSYLWLQLSQKFHQFAMFPKG